MRANPSRYGMLSIMLTIKAAREQYSLQDLEVWGSWLIGTGVFSEVNKSK